MPQPVCLLHNVDFCKLSVIELIYSIIRTPPLNWTVYTQQLFQRENINVLQLKMVIEDTP